ncbi:MAG: hypothetical protein HYS65_01390 [Betaproteobacteria bacterium]|nr:hypothetical protein [Betaproteobacteria bacterium]
MMKRDQCLKLLAKYHRDELVVPVYQATFEWLAIKPDAPTFTAVGAMGQASSLALGLALGLQLCRTCPCRRLSRTARVRGA